VHDLEWGCLVIYVVDRPGNAEHGLVFLLVSELYVVAGENLTQDHHTTLALSASTLTWCPSVKDESTVSRLSSRVGEGRLVGSGVTDTRCTQRATISVVQSVEQVLKGRLGQVGLHRHVTLDETTSGNVNNLVDLQLLVLLVDA